MRSTVLLYARTRASSTEAAIGRRRDLAHSCGIIEGEPHAMSRLEQSISTEYFDALYASDPDPWGFATRDYELLKYAATVAAFPKRRYISGFEAGCSIGVLTRMIAERCDALVAGDVSATAVGQARARCADRPHVAVDVMRIPQQWPDGPFDLVVLSEILCLIGAADIEALVPRLDATLERGGHVVVVHVRGRTRYRWDGDEVVDFFLGKANPVAQTLTQASTDRYRIDVLERK
jgi:SAM-dependent methyltransferase